MQEIAFELDLGEEVFCGGSGGGGTAHLEKKNALLTVPIFFLLLFPLCHSPHPLSFCFSNNDDVV